MNHALLAPRGGPSLRRSLSAGSLRYGLGNDITGRASLRKAGELERERGPLERERIELERQRNRMREQRQIAAIDAERRAVQADTRRASTIKSHDLVIVIGVLTTAILGCPRRCARSAPPAGWAPPWSRSAPSNPASTPSSPPPPPSSRGRASCSPAEGVPVCVARPHSTRASFAQACATRWSRACRCRWPRRSCRSSRCRRG